MCLNNLTGEVKMADGNRRINDSGWRKILGLIPLVLIAGSGLVAYGAIRDRVSQHDQLLTEIRVDIKEILSRLPRK